MQLRPGKVALVTGAAGGLGRALAVALAQRGCDAALVDVDAAGLARVSQEIEALGRHTSMHQVDVGDPTQVALLPQQVAVHHGAVHVLVNSAGVSLAGPFERYAIGDIDWIVGINFLGAVYVCHCLLPLLREGGEGHIANVASGFALVGMPTKTMYSATKFALRGFSEALRAELHGAGIGVSLIIPGAVATRLVAAGRATDPAQQVREAQFLASSKLDAARAADIAVRAIERNAAQALIGLEPRVFDLAVRWFPGLTRWALARLWRRVPFL